MFSKSYKFKASNSLKTSYRKTLVQKLKEKYRHLTEDDLKEIIPLKADLVSVKVITNSEDSINIYTVDNVPCLMEIDDAFYPTIFALWRCPHMIPSIVIESHLAGKLQGGIIHLRRSHLPPFGSQLPKFSKGSPVSVSTVDNIAPILVGIASYASDEMLIVQTGICVRTLNIIGDYLCTGEKFTKVPRPELGLIITDKEKINEVSKDLSEMKIQNDDSNDQECNDGETKQIFNDDDLNNSESIMNPDDTIVDDFPADMEGLLQYCLLCFLKEHGKKADLPLKTNLLYANHMLTYCPPDRTLDVKKSSYKKMGKFLEAMEKEGLLKIKEIEKGVDAVIAINVAHDLIKQHNVIEIQALPSQNDDSSYNPPKVRESFRMTAAVVPLFSSSSFKKGQTISSADVRNQLVNYVKANNLQDAQKNLVKIDPILGTFTNEVTTIPWDQLVSAVLKKMTACTEIIFPDGRVKVLSGKLAQITMQVAKRSGNKKVTIVSNLEEYGISLSTLSKECQHGVAASCTITRTAGSKTDQLQVQGDQTYFLTKHLTEFYGLPKKYINGADKYLSKKKN